LCFDKTPTEGNVSHAVIFFAAGISGVSPLGKQPNKDAREYIAQVRNLIRNSADIQQRILDKAHDQEKIAVEILSVLGIPAALHSAVISIISVEIALFIQQNKKPLIEPIKEIIDIQGDKRQNDPGTYTEALAFQKAGIRALRETITRFFKSRKLSFGNQLKDDESINKTLELILQEDKDSLLMAEHYSRHSMMKPEGLILAALRSLRDKDSPQLKNSLKVISILSGAIIFIALSGTDLSLMNFMGGLIISSVLFLPGWAIHELGHFIAKDGYKFQSKQMKGGPIASFLLFGVTFLSFIFLHDAQFNGVYYGIFLLTASIIYLTHGLADDMAAFNSNGVMEPYINEDDLRAFFDKINIPLQKALLEGTKTQEDTPDYKMIELYKYPYVCLYASALCKDIIERYFGSSLKNVKMVQGKASSESEVNRHIWLEITLTNKQVFYLSVVDGQFAEGFTGKKLENVTIVKEPFRNKARAGAVTENFREWAFKKNSETYVLLENIKGSVKRYLAKFGIRRSLFKKDVESSVNSRKLGQLFNLFLNAYREENNIADHQKDAFLISMGSPKDEEQLRYSIWETMYGRDKAEKVAPLYEETGWGAIELLKYLRGKNIGFEEWVRNIFFAMELFIGSRTFPFITNIITFLFYPDSFLTVFSAVIMSNAVAFAVLHNNKDLKDLMRKYNAGIILNMINLVFPIIGPVIAHQYWNNRYAEKYFPLMVKNREISQLQQTRVMDIQTAIKRLFDRKQQALVTRIVEELEQMHKEDPAIEVLTFDQVYRSIKTNKINVQSMHIDTEKRKADIIAIAKEHEKKHGQKPTVKEVIKIIGTKDPFNTINYQNLMKWMEGQDLSIEDLGMRKDKQTPQEFLEEMIQAAERITENTGSKNIESADLLRELNIKTSAFSQRKKRLQEKGFDIEKEFQQRGFVFVKSTGLARPRAKKRNVNIEQIKKADKAETPNVEERIKDNGVSAELDNEVQQDNESEDSAITVPEEQPVKEKTRIKRKYSQKTRTNLTDKENIEKKGFAYDISSEKKKSIKRSIANLLSNFKGKRLIQIVPLVQKQYQDKDYLRVTIEMLEEDELSDSDKDYVEKLKQDFFTEEKGIALADSGKSSDVEKDISLDGSLEDNDHQNKELISEMRRRTLLADEKEELISLLMWVMDISQTSDSDEVKAYALQAQKRMRSKLKEIFVKEGLFQDQEESFLGFFMKDQRIHKSFERFLLALFREQQPVYSVKTAEPNSIILYADDIISNAMLFDLERTLMLTCREGGILSKGKIFLYCQGKVPQSQINMLQDHIQTIAENVKVILIMADDVLNKEEKELDPGKQLDKLLRYLKRRDCDGDQMPELIEKKVLAIIKSNDNSIVDLYGAYDYKIPIILMNGHENGLLGIFSLSQALNLAFTIRKNNGLRGWIKVLDSVDDTETAYKYYRIYREEVLTAL
ncbi:MAG: hypothetical protein PHQ52_05975, partial [Candidatus Omnitrophica bacterium]|nr:hypothetical protein [Candidatus Omnitrophota bacterium]